LLRFREADEKPVHLTLPSFAKINWSLEILGKRQDGFHEIRTLIQTVDLHDILRFDFSPGSHSELRIQGRDLSAGPDNLIQRALAEFRQAFGIQVGARVFLEKRIPLGAGLGGGSSNAAVTLLALARACGGVDPVRLESVAARLGSDVPFFLHGGLALAEGRGERVVEFHDEGVRARLLLVWPRFSVTTSTAYGAVQAPEWEPRGRLTAGGAGTRIRQFLELLEAGEWECLRNDLEEPVFRLYPQLRELKHQLRESGCTSVMLSGSGSTLLAAGDPTSLEHAGEFCKRQDRGEVFISETLSRRAYWERLGLARPKLKQRRAAGS
jgi:4-diphosphocytidyl-2-C-methyl-D-erythritol kinase